MLFPKIKFMFGSLKNLKKTTKNDQHITIKNKTLINKVDLCLK